MHSALCLEYPAQEMLCCFSWGFSIPWYKGIFYSEGQGNLPSAQVLKVPMGHNKLLAKVDIMLNANKFSSASPIILLCEQGCSLIKHKTVLNALVLTVCSIHGITHYQSRFISFGEIITPLGVRLRKHKRVGKCKLCVTYWLLIPTTPIIGLHHVWALVYCISIFITTKLCLPQRTM